MPLVAHRPHGRHSAHYSAAGKPTSAVLTVRDPPEWLEGDADTGREARAHRVGGGRDKPGHTQTTSRMPPPPRGPGAELVKPKGSVWRYSSTCRGRRPRQPQVLKRFLGSILRLMGPTLPWPDHTMLSRRHATVTVRRQIGRASQGPRSLLVDSGRLKVCGQGEWHGEKQHQCWKKLHIGVDAPGQMVASMVTQNHAQDPLQVPQLLAQANRVIDRFMGDGINDQALVYTAIENPSPGVRTVVPSRKDAVWNPTASTAPSSRDLHLLEIEMEDRFVCKRTSGYDDQTHDDNAVSRFKRTFGDRLRAKQDESQEWEA